MVSIAHNEIIPFVSETISTPRRLGAYWCYILKCDDIYFYCGISYDWYKRLLEHRAKKSKYTSRFKNIECVWKERFVDKYAAHNMESRIKGIGVRKFYFQVSSK